MVAKPQKSARKAKRVVREKPLPGDGLIAGLEAGIAGHVAHPIESQSANSVALKALKEWNPPELIKMQKRIHQSKN